MRLRVQAHAKHSGGAAGNPAPMHIPLPSAAHRNNGSAAEPPHGQRSDGTEHANGVSNGAALAAWVPAASVHSRYALKKQQSMLAGGAHAPDDEAASANGVPGKHLASVPSLPPEATLPPPPSSALWGHEAGHAGGLSAAQPNSKGTDRTGRRGKRRAQHPEPMPGTEVLPRHPANSGSQPSAATAAPMSPSGSASPAAPDDPAKARALQLQQLPQRQLTAKISKAQSWAELADLFVDRRPELNAIHVSAMLVRLAHLETAPRSGWSAGLAAGSSSGFQQQLEAQLPTTGRRQADLSASAEPSRALGQQQADTAAPVGRTWIAPQNRRQVLKLRKQLKAQQQQQQLDLDSGLSRPAAAPLSSDSMVADSSGGSRAVGVIGRADTPAQGPSSLLSLRKCPTPKHLARALCREADARLAGMGLRELSAALAAALKLGCPLDKPAVVRYMTRAFHVLGEDGQRRQHSQQPGSGGKPEQPSSGKAGRTTPMTASSSSGEQRHRGVDGVDDLPTAGVTAQGLSELIWSVSGFGMQGLRPDWAARFLGAVRLHCGDFSAQGVAVLLHSLAALGHMPPPELRQQLLERLVQLAEVGDEGCDSSLLGTVDRAAKKQQYQPGHQRQGLAPADVSMTFRALAVLRTRPPGDLGDRLLLATQRLLPAFSAQELANTVWGLAKLRTPPPTAAWSADFCTAASATILGGQRGPPGSTAAVQEPDSSVAIASATIRLHGGQQQAAPGWSPSSSAVTTLEEPIAATAASGSGAQALSMTLYSMALLRLRPDEAFMGACLRYTSQHYGSFTIQVSNSGVDINPHYRYPAC